MLRVLRGGAFDHDSYYCRSPVRYRNVPYSRNSYYGFRVVWSPLL